MKKYIPLILCLIVVIGLVLGVRAYTVGRIIIQRDFTHNILYRISDEYQFADEEPSVIMLGDEAYVIVRIERKDGTVGDYWGWEDATPVELGDDWFSLPDGERVEEATNGEAD